MDCYKILIDRKVVVEYYTGNFSLKELVALKEQLSVDPEYNPEYSIIDDFRDVHMKFTQEDMMGYLNYVKENKRVYGKRNSAFLTRTSQQVVLGSLFNSLNVDVPISVSIVSSVEAAVKAIGLSSDDTKVIENVLSELKGRCNE